MAKFDMTQLEKATSIPAGSLHLVEMGDGSGTKAVTQEVLEEKIGEALKVGDLEQLQTEDKTNLVAAINEAAQSGGGGAAVDILDTPEEIEANTETGKAAGAAAVKAMFGALNDNLKGFSPVIDPETGQITGYKTTAGADTVFPFKKTLVKVGQATSASTTINISNLSNYNVLAADDFIMAIVSCSAVLNTSRDVAGTLNLRPKLTYDSNTGMIKVDGLSTYLSGWNGVNFTNSCVVDVYMVK